MRRQCVADFETASAVDLTAVGAWRYAEDPTTEILCLCWRILGGRNGRWVPGDDTAELTALALDPDVLFIAHNAGFEKAIWRRMMMPIFGLPDIPNDRWHDTMAVCAMKAVPQKLEKVMKVLELGEKDMVGSKFTKSLSKARKDGTYDRSPASLQRVYTYCDHDVDDEVKLHHRVGWLSPSEKEVWLLDQEINERGVGLDMPFVGAARKIVDDATAPLAKEFIDLTGVEFTQVQKFGAWVQRRGVFIPDMTKQTVARVLGGSIDEEDLEDDVHPEGEQPVIELPDDVRRALYIRQLVGSASVKKLAAMERCVCADASAYGLLQYHAAGPGRWAGRLFQPQNLPVGTIEVDGEAPAVDLLVQAVMTGDYQYVQALLGPAVEVVISSLRHAILARPGRSLVVGDFAGVEARLVLALAGQHDKTALMASGADVYCDMAGLIYERPITKKDFFERKIGKNTVLGCGFQMGAPKFRARYAKHMPLEFCQGVIEAYRKEWAPEVPKVWRGLERAALGTVRTGHPHDAYSTDEYGRQGISLGVRYQLEDGWLTARLPSGRKLWYRNPKLVQKRMPWDEDDIRWAWTYQAWKMGQWKTIDAYGGLLTENVVQALARDLMVYAMLLCRREGLPVILTVHDEIIAEPEEWAADPSLLKQLMEDRPSWAQEMQVPILSETWAGPRYRK